MASEILKRDENHEPVIGLVTDDANQFIKMGRIDDTTKGLKVMLVGGTGLGTVTSVSVISANGFVGTVATPTTTPAITLSTTLNTPVIAGNGTAIIAGTTTGTGSTVVLDTSPTVTGLILSGFLQGSMLFAGPGGVIAQNNSNWFINDSANKMLLGITTVTDPLIGATSRSIIFSGTASGFIGNDINTVANTAGQAFVVRAGSATAGSTDKNGGTLFLRPGATNGYLTRALNNAVLVQSSPQLISGKIGTISATPTAGGAGYTAGDTLTITSGDGTATVTATTVVAGAVTVATLVSGGTSGYAVSAGNATSGGTGAGCTLSITALTGTAANVLVTTAYFTDSGLHIGGGASAATARLQISPGSVGTGSTSVAWTTAGIWLRVVAGTYTDNTSAPSATVATVVGGSIGIPTFAFANTLVTITDASNLYINGAPVAGTNATITNTWALHAVGKFLNVADAANQIQHELRTNRSSVATGDIVGGTQYRSNDTTITAPGAIVSTFTAVSTATHTGTVLDTDFVWSSTKGVTLFENMRLRPITTSVAGLGININAPLAQLHLGAGTATAGTAPIRFTSGTNLTSAVAGTMEYDGTELYFSPSTTRRKLALVTAGASIVTTGVYTPTRSAEANMDGNVTMTEAQYMRVGDTVTVSGQFSANPTLTATVTSFEITLPVASNIGAVEDASGVAFSGAIAGMGAAIAGVVANDTAKIFWLSSDINAQTWSYTFTYQII